MGKRTNKKKDEMMSLNELHLSKRIWWIRSFPTLRKWLIRDIKKGRIKGVIMGEGNATRYFFSKSEIEKYVRNFEKGNY